MAHLAADYYVSVENGDDLENGTTEALAWATIDHAASTVTAGNTVAIAPGTYRETIVADNVGGDGTEIIFIGDPECLYFDNEMPGRVRVTGADVNEEEQAVTVILSEKNYVQWRKLWVDGGSRGIDFDVTESVIRTAYDCIISSKSIGVMQGSAIRCIGIGGNTAFQACTCVQCIGLAGNECFRNGNQFNCLAIGGVRGFTNVTVNTDSSIALCNDYGFVDPPAAAGGVLNCFALHCDDAGSAITAGECVGCYYSGCDGVGDADYGSLGRVVQLNYAALWDLLPWFAENQAGSLIRQGENTRSSFGAADLDAEQHRLRLKGADLDIGPWSVSEPPDTPYHAGGPGLLDWGTAETTPPGLKITTEGDYAIKVPAEAGTEITVTVQSMHDGIGAEDKPQLLLEGDSITNQTDTNAAVDEAWDELSVAATPAVDEVLTVMFRARNNAGDCYFSDLTVS